ncbi:uncharacterized protein CELE_C05B5.2 [Caenorhabditis elegans]|uniref:Uncharacterized protein C05B5.2 n=1 Tax=Caenorhabditis elegans TaxID=6239 RepID=YKO2_CAEEL|nr:Uncharacterized protein CELE_C05B5.2 [Caenorhabditis elegans]P34290.3 RecName: Full=Uncharacterized protein C05B5.2 [Caenorhabditis elegans]CAA83592.2 Uncharacterized protein CELE_C05B5.2 [Caenorhabditis elegans]|eukprot:NP_499218.2 Uncharacterized protein CELE_C05B5.2 [Caenorhabditis elegans]
MLNIVLIIGLLAIFNTSSASNDVCHVTRKPLMLPAPGDVYKKAVQFYSNITAPRSTSVLAPVMSSLEVYINTTTTSAFAPAQSIKVADILEEDADAIRVKSIRMAGFIAQCIIFLFVYTIVTMDVEIWKINMDWLKIQYFQHFEDSAAEVPVFKLYMAREIQTCPLPARQNVMIVRQFMEMESNC